MENETYCYYSDLPSPLAYIEAEAKKVELSDFDINRVIEMAWEDRTSFDAIKIQFGLSESEVKALMKKTLKFTSYLLWRKRVTRGNMKHALKRDPIINRFKCNLQRTISHNKISKRR